MNKATYSQIQAVMRHYLKPGVPYRRKQVNRLVAMLDNIFIHEKNLGDSIERLGRKHIIGYWRRTCHESKTVRAEKYRIFLYFVEQANLPLKVPIPK